MNRTCDIDDCTNLARPGRRICHKHRIRIARHGNPDYTEWTVADEYDVELIVREQRPVEGLTRLERVMVARGLHGRLPGDEIARIVGVTPRTVWRWAAEGLEAGGRLVSRCTGCGRHLLRPSPSGLGPVCARRLAATTPHREADAA